MKNPQSVMITGGSSGIGAALAKLYAGPGKRVVLTGRRQERIDQAVAAAAAAGGEVAGSQVDVADRAAMADLFAQHTPFDLVIANAGISAGTGSGGGRADADAEIFRINLDGVLNTVYPALAQMRDRPANADGVRGQVAIMASLAAFISSPGAAAYSASKAAVRSWGEALRQEVAPEGIEVNVICPGWVKSRLSDQNRFSMPMLMETDRAARLIVRRLAKNRARIAFPWPMYVAARAVGGLPPFLSGPMLRSRRD